MNPVVLENNGRTGVEIDAPRTGTADMIVPDSWARLVGIDCLMSTYRIEDERALKRMQTTPERMLYGAVLTETLSVPCIAGPV